MDCSKLFKLCKSDIVKGFIIAIISGPVGVIVDNAQIFLADPTKPWTLNVKVLIAYAVVGGGAYLIKKLFTGSNDKMLTNK